MNSVYVLADLYLFARVSTTYGGDLLPPVQKRIEFSPRRQPGVYLGDDVAMALRSGTKKFLTALDFFLLFFLRKLLQ